jgi:hypothetical protein
MAELLSIATVLGGLSALWFFWDKVVDVWNRRRTKQPKATALLRLTTLDALQDFLQSKATFEHVADNQTVSLSDYPSLLDVRVHGPVGPTSSLMRFGGGASLDLTFKDDVLGLGFFYKQGSYPCIFALYLADGRKEVVVGDGYFPTLGFVGLATETPIERLIVQPQASGGVDLVNVHVFSRSFHKKEVSLP